MEQSLADNVKALKQIPDGATHVSICTRCRELLVANQKYANFAELSADAWKVSGNMAGCAVST